MTLRVDFEPSKVLMFSKNTLLPLAILGVFLVYFFSMSEFSEEAYHSLHMAFMLIILTTILVAFFFKIPSQMLSISIIYVSYLIINSSRYSYGEDYIFSASYNIWCMILLPNLLLVHFIFTQNKFRRYWSFYYIFLFLQTALIEKLQNQSIDADSYYFYKHIGMVNYPALYISMFCIIILIIKQITKGRILNASILFSAISIFIGIYFSDNLFAFSLFFLSAAIIELFSVTYYTYYIQLKDEQLDIPNLNAFLKDEKKKYPLKYSIALMYIDEYDRLLKRFGESKSIVLKKMFLNRIRKAKPNLPIYNYRPDALILAFMNENATESFEEAEEIRRLLAKSIFVFDENNHLQLTVSQCVSEKKRSDADAQAVMTRAEENLQKACKFTRNITVKA